MKLGASPCPSYILDHQTMTLILKAMLIIVTASLKTNETIDQPTINNSSQTNRLQTCAILYKAQATCTCISIYSFILCVMLTNQRPWMIDNDKNNLFLHSKVSKLACIIIFCNEENGEPSHRLNLHPMIKVCKQQPKLQTMLWWCAY